MVPVNDFTAVGAAYAAPSRGAQGRLLQASGARRLTIMPVAPAPCHPPRQEEDRHVR
jgi:hypothetical protein